MTDKIEIEKIKINLEVDKMRLFKKKNSLIVKKEKLRLEIVTINIVGSSNVSTRNQLDSFLKLIRNKFKVKRLISFDNIKKNFQKFFTGT